mmetsp:Transcript_13229/g.32335  ORF Transcript_13229/g.32335 Transcript_13229/m.32335 type:complete len:337 (+) Transcript_13229:1477-2487(+)
MAVMVRAHGRQLLQGEHVLALLALLPRLLLLGGSCSCRDRGLLCGGCSCSGLLRCCLLGSSRCLLLGHGRTGGSTGRSSRCLARCAEGRAEQNLDAAWLGCSRCSSSPAGRACCSAAHTAAAGVRAPGLAASVPIPCLAHIAAGVSCSTCLATSCFAAAGGGGPCSYCRLRLATLGCSRGGGGRGGSRRVISTWAATALGAWPFKGLARTCTSSVCTLPGLGCCLSFCCCLCISFRLGHSRCLGICLRFGLSLSTRLGRCFRLGFGRCFRLCFRFGICLRFGLGCSFRLRPRLSFCLGPGFCVGLRLGSGSCCSCLAGCKLLHERGRLADRCCRGR